jgi:hypothetical protein
MSVPSIRSIAITHPNGELNSFFSRFLIFCCFSSTFFAKFGNKYLTNVINIPAKTQNIIPFVSIIFLYPELKIVANLPYLAMSYNHNSIVTRVRVLPFNFRRKLDMNQSSAKSKWCPGKDSNLHTLASSST